MLLKIDLESEDIPGGETTVGAMLLITNIVVPPVSLVVGLISFGLGYEAAGNADAGGKDDTAVKEESNPVAEDMETFEAES